MSGSRRIQKDAKQSFLHGALILAIATGLVKLIGMVYKIPIQNILGQEGSAHFQVAYQIYSVLFALSTAGLPVAISKMVSEAEALGRPQESREVFRVASTLFFVIGVVGSLAMFFGAPVIAVWMNDAGDAVAPIRAIAPAIFFVCIICPFRGYHQGMGNMKPTAMSQIIEVAGKAAFGLLLVHLAVNASFGIDIQASAAILGVSVGTALAAVYMFFVKRPHAPEGRQNHSRRGILSTLLKIALPITIGSAVLNITSLIDTSLVLGRLQSAAGFTEQAAKEVYGAYTWAITFFNFPPGFIIPLSISIIPALSAARTNRNQKLVVSTVRSSLRVTSLLVFPAALGMMVLSNPILTMFYGAHPEGVAIGAPLLSTLAIGIIFVSLVSLTSAILQSLGLVSLPVATMAVGALAKIVCNYVLVGNPSININGAPIGTVLCYALISVLNLLFILRVTRSGARTLSVFIKPLIAALGMAFVARGSYFLFIRFTGNTISLLGAILLGCLCYFVLVLLLRALPKSDLMSIPKGENIAKFLRIK